MIDDWAKRKMVSAARSRAASVGGLPRTRRRSVPSAHSVVSTRRPERSATTSGTRMDGCPAKRSAKACWWAASMPVVELVGHPERAARRPAPARRRCAGVTADSSAPDALAVGQVGTDRRLDAGVLHLDRHAPGRRASVARCTWPIDAAATGIGSQRRRTRSAGSAPSSTRTTSAASDGAIGGASACSWASAAWASGGRPSPTNDSIWPSFMTAPFICPSSRAASSAERMAKPSSSSARRAGVGPHLARLGSPAGRGSGARSAPPAGAGAGTGAATPHVRGHRRSAPSARPSSQAESARSSRRVRLGLRLAPTRRRRPGGVTPGRRRCRG